MHISNWNADLALRLAVVATALALVWIMRPAGAQSCKDLPPGPAKKQCVMQNHPEVFEKKKERCLALAQQRDSVGKGSGERDFMQSCMQGRVAQ